MLRPASCVLLLALTAACGGMPSQPDELQYAEAPTTARDCLVSGSHIRTQRGSCSSTGRSHYWANRRGGTTADTLRRLDPAVTVRSW
jgi:hypothetical protein